MKSSDKHPGVNHVASSLVIVSLCTGFSLSSMNAAPATDAVNSLGIDLLSRSQPADGNALLSPYSIQSVLVMAYAGADGDTKTQMAGTLHYANDSIVTDFAALRSEIAALGTKDSPITLSIADRLFGQKGYPFLPDYLDLLKNTFSAPLELADFETQPAAAAKRINAWVKEQTNDKIPMIVPDGALNEDTRLVLVNAIYLKALWRFPFIKGATNPMPFALADGKKVDVPMMRLSESVGYQKAEGFVAVSLPYENSDLQFVVILPEEDCATFEKTLTPEILAGFAKMSRQQVDLSLPKFRLDPPLMSLADSLKSLGMTYAFNIPTGTADFSGIAVRKPDDYLYISDIFHKTFVDVDENGTEAAAATAAVMMRATMAPMDPVTVTVDRPFLFAIQHRPSGTCLFLGRMANPAVP